MNYIEKALEWYNEHKEHIDELIEIATTTFKPCKEDLHHPELWKPESWKWFLEIQNDDYRNGFLDGLQCFAHWADGEQYVGTSGTTLKEATESLEELWNYKRI